MAELVMQNWILLVVALLIGIAVAWWILTSASRKRVKIEREDTPAEEAPARRNQALIDAPPAASAGNAPSPEPVPPSPAAPETPVVPKPSPVAEPRTSPPSVAAPAAPATGADDLTRIKGLGPKLADQLRAMGVRSFAEIAAWNEADIDRIDEQLGRFRGRIRRDSWPEQARLLAAQDVAGYEARFGKL